MHCHTAHAHHGTVALDPTASHRIPAAAGTRSRLRLELAFYTNNAVYFSAIWSYDFLSGRRGGGHFMMAAGWAACRSAAASPRRALCKAVAMHAAAPRPSHLVLDTRFSSPAHCL